VSIAILLHLCRPESLVADSENEDENENENENAIRTLLTKVMLGPAFYEDENLRRIWADPFVTG
jgi:hypothetical protein